MNSPHSNDLQRLLHAYSPSDLLSAIAAEKARRSAESELEQKRRSSGKLTLAQYVREAWHVLHPATPLLWGWALDAICLHLEAVTYGRLLDMGLTNRLLVNVP